MTGAASDRRSGAIATARLLCILGVVYVHGWTGLDGHRLAQLHDTPQALLRWSLIELVGRAAVPLLGAISGWLAAGSAATRAWGAFMAGKLRAVGAPMLVWNAIALLLVGGGAHLGLVAAPQPTSAWGIVNELTALAAPNEINVQMPFLRDLLVCMALAPLLARAPAWVLAAVIAGTAAWSISGAQLLLLLRPSILTFFALGLWLRRDAALLDRLGARPISGVALLYVALALVRVAVEVRWDDPAGSHPQAVAGYDLAMRAVACLFFWQMAWQLARRARWAWLRGLERYVFLAFCSHVLLMWLAAPLVGRITGPLGAPFYPVFLLLQPALAMAAAVGIGRVLAAISGRMAGLLSGGRLAPARADG